MWNLDESATDFLYTRKVSNYNKLVIMNIYQIDNKNTMEMDVSALWVILNFYRPIWNVSYAYFARPLF